MPQLPLDIPEVLRVGLRWLHFLAFTAWLGAILVVHFILRPQVAARGIPRPFMRLAWLAIAIISLSGGLLTLSMVGGLETVLSTRWGKVLMVKTILFLGMVSIAIYDSFFISPRLRRLSAAELEFGSEAELLKRGDGQEGRPIYVGYRGAVYDLTASPNWRRGLHLGLHWAGQDLTQELARAPHNVEVLTRFPQIKSYWETSLAYRRLWRRFQYLAPIALGLGLAALLAAAFWY